MSAMISTPSSSATSGPALVGRIRVGDRVGRVVLGGVGAQQRREGRQRGQGRQAQSLEELRRGAVQHRAAGTLLAAGLHDEAAVLQRADHAVGVHAADRRRSGAG